PAADQRGWLERLQAGQHRPREVPRVRRKRELRRHGGRGGELQAGENHRFGWGARRIRGVHDPRHRFPLECDGPTVDLQHGLQVLESEHDVLLRHYVEEWHAHLVQLRTQIAVVRGGSAFAAALSTVSVTKGPVGGAAEVQGACEVRPAYWTGRAAPAPRGSALSISCRYC